MRGSNLPLFFIMKGEVTMKTEKIIVGDRDGSEFNKIKQAFKRETTTTYLDLE